MSNYPHSNHPSGYPYNAPPPSQSYTPGSYGGPPPPSQSYTHGSYGGPPPPSQSYPSGHYSGQPHPNQSSPYAPIGAPYSAPSGATHQSYGGYPTPAPSAPYGSPFASPASSAFPPGTDPNVIAHFQMADQDGSGFIDDKELQRILSSYNESFGMRTVHLLMYLFTNSSVRKIGPKEFTQVYYCLQSWRAIFERFDRDRSGKIDSSLALDFQCRLWFWIYSFPSLTNMVAKTRGLNMTIS